MKGINKVADKEHLETRHVLRKSSQERFSEEMTFVLNVER